MIVAIEKKNLSILPLKNQPVFQQQNNFGHLSFCNIGSVLLPKNHIA